MRHPQGACTCWLVPIAKARPAMRPYRYISRRVLFCILIGIRYDTRITGLFAYDYRFSDKESIGAQLPPGPLQQTADRELRGKSATAGRQ
jgi:hypothetical protein